MMDGAPGPYTWEWWKLVVAIIAGSVSGILTAGFGFWNLQRRIESLEKVRTEDLVTRQKESLESRPFCEKQKKEILELLRTEICQIVKSSMKDLKIEHNTELADIKLQLALVIQGNANIREDIIELFKRMNERRRGDNSE